MAGEYEAAVPADEGPEMKLPVFVRVDTRYAGPFVVAVSSVPAHQARTPQNPASQEFLERVAWRSVPPSSPAATLPIT